MSDPRTSASRVTLRAPCLGLAGHSQISQSQARPTRIILSKYFLIGQKVGRKKRQRNLGHTQNVNPGVIISVGFLLLELHADCKFYLNNY